MYSALYGREVEEEEEEEDDEEDQPGVHRLPDLLFRKAPQLLQYTAALHSRYDNSETDSSDGDDREEEELDVQRERRGELRLDSHIGTTHVITLNVNVCVARNKMDIIIIIIILFYCFSVKS